MIISFTHSDISSSDLTNDNQSDALFRTLEDTFSNYVKLNKKVPPEVISSITELMIYQSSRIALRHMTLKLRKTTSS